MREQRRLLTGVAPNRVPVDLTGYTGRCHIRLKASSPEFLVDMSSANGGFVLVGAADGTFALVLSADVTAALTFKTAVYDIELAAPDGVVSRVLQGTVTLSHEVTR